MSVNPGLLGRMPVVLENLTPAEIEQAGVEGWDAQTFLQSKGLTDSKLLDKAVRFIKWTENYTKGYAKYKLALASALKTAAITDGDTQLLKELAKSVLNIKPEEGGTEKKFTVIGAGTPVSQKGNRGAKKKKDN